MSTSQTGLTRCLDLRFTRGTVSPFLWQLPSVGTSPHALNRGAAAKARQTDTIARSCADVCQVLQVRNRCKSLYDVSRPNAYAGTVHLWVGILERIGEPRFSVSLSAAFSAALLCRAVISAVERARYTRLLRVCGPELLSSRSSGSPKHPCKVLAPMQ